MFGRFKFELLNKYPHLKYHDLVIWEKFILAYPDFFHYVDYDVCVGDIRGDTSDLEPEWQRDANYLGKYKIDVVGYREDIIYIIELKPKAAAKALGQIIMYDFLYTRDFKPEGPTHAMIITDEEMPNMLELCKEHNVILIKV